MRTSHGVLRSWRPRDSKCIEGPSHFPFPGRGKLSVDRALPGVGRPARRSGAKLSVLPETFELCGKRAPPSELLDCPMLRRYHPQVLRTRTPGLWPSRCGRRSAPSASRARPHECGSCCPFGFRRCVTEDSPFWPPRSDERLRANTGSVSSTAPWCVCPSQRSTRYAQGALLGVALGSYMLHCAACPDRRRGRRLVRA
jgi:hypothetical protein